MIHIFYHESAGWAVRGRFQDQGGLFPYIFPEKWVPANPPLRKIREQAREVLKDLSHSKAYDTSDHVAALRAANVTPHVAQNNSTTKTGRQRKSAIDGRTTRHAGCGMSQTRHAMIECIFGRDKQHGTMRKTKHRGIAGVAADFLLNLIAYNLIRIPKLLAA